MIEWALLPAPASASSRGEAYGSSEAPSFPVRSTTGLVSEPRTGDRHAEHLARVCDQEVARPLRERRPARRDGMLGLERAEQRPVFGLRKPDEEPSPARMLHSRTAGTRHDLLISESQDVRSLSRRMPKRGPSDAHPFHLLPTGLACLPPSYQSPPKPPS